MASKVQQQLDFPVRRSRRQSKPSQKALDSGDKLFTPTKQNGLTPRDTMPRQASRQRQIIDRTPPASKSPTKRKPTGLLSPPTPPKSPCKAVSVTRSRSSSPEIYSEESEDELTDQKSSPSTARHDSHPPTVTTPKMNRMAVPRLSQENLSPRQQTYGLASCLSTPPRSPFVAPNHRHLSVCRDLAMRIVPPSSTTKTPTTPTRTPSKLQMSPQKSQMPTKEVVSPRKVPSKLPSTPTKTPSKSEMLSAPHNQLSDREVLSPKRAISKLPSTPTKTPSKSGMLSAPQNQLSNREVLSPKRTPSKLPGTPTKTSNRLRMLSPQKTQQSSREVSSPKKTPSKGNEENFVLKSPKLLPKLQIAKPDRRGYQQAKQSLHTAKPEQLVGRDQEVAEISGFLKTHLEKKTAGSLYISGAPGTGKTAALLHIIDEFKAQHKCQIAYLNCMMVKDVSSVFRRLHAELSGKPAAGRTTVKDMEKLVTTSKHNMILVLDEIDQLDSKNQDVLYTIFEWPSLDHSRLILVGVANALDLTDRILPRLQAKPRCRPKLLHFAPYTRDQIAAIITDRLGQPGTSVVENSAVQFCARKVSAVAGDMRKALDVCRRAVELAESETRSQTVLKISDCNSPSKSQPGQMKKISVGHISKVMSEVYGSSVQSQQSDGVPLQQKLLVCTLLLAVKTGKFKEVPLGKLHETYCKVCRRQQMTPVDQSEFHSLCVLLEARGVVGMKKAKETRLIKVTLRQDEKELEQTLQDRVLVSAILKEGLPK